jgi:hypothetical protein
VQCYIKIISKLYYNTFIEKFCIITHSDIKIYFIKSGGKSCILPLCVSTMNDYNLRMIQLYSEIKYYYMNTPSRWLKIITEICRHVFYSQYVQFVSCKSVLYLSVVLTIYSMKQFYF